MANPSWFDTVQRIMDRYGVPASVWYPIVEADSGGNPNAIGDSGNSIGLFQINTAGGQGQAYANNKNALMDPALNASVAAPAIWSAYTIIKDQYPADQLASETARRSGHPGGSVQDPFNASDARILRIADLAKQYVAASGPSSNATSPVSRALADNGITSASDALGKIGDFITGLQNIDFAAIGVGVVGLIFIILAVVTLKPEMLNPKNANA